MFNPPGISHEQIKKIIKDELNRNSDLLVGIDDPEMQEMIEVICNAFSKAIDANNKKLALYIEERLEKI